MSVIFEIFKVKDRELLEQLKAIAEECVPSENNAAFSIAIAPGIDPIYVNAKELFENEMIAEVLSADSSVLWNVTLNIPTRQFSISVNRKLAGSDEVTIAYPQQHNSGQPDFTTALSRFIATCQKHLHTFTKIEHINKFLGKELAEFYQLREQALLKLEDFSQRLTQDSLVYRKELNEESKKRESQIFEEYKIQKERLEMEFSAKEEALKVRESELEERAKQMDDRASRHARRQLRQDLKSILKERSEQFSLSEKTSAKRKPVHLLFWILILAAGCLFLKAIWRDIDTAPANYTWYLLLRVPLSGLALAASVLFYIRWNDQWAKQHADEEFRLKRLELDIDRASWVVEMALEWKDDEGTEIPQALVDRLTRNLFLEDTSEVVRHPTEDLASALLGASSSLNLKTPAGDLILDRKGIKEFKKATASDS